MHSLTHTNANARTHHTHAEAHYRHYATVLVPTNYQLSVDMSTVDSSFINLFSDYFKK